MYLQQVHDVGQRGNLKWISSRQSGEFLFCSSLFECGTLRGKGRRCSGETVACGLSSLTRWTKASVEDLDMLWLRQGPSLNDDLSGSTVTASPEPLTR